MPNPFADVAPGCINLIEGGTFEQFNPAWQIQVSNRTPSYSNEQTFNGSAQSMRIGNGLELPDVESISEVRHVPILLPYGATRVILRFVYWPLYESTPGVGDLQQADLFDATTDQLILPLLTVQDNARAWKAVDYDLTSYAGRQVSLRFRVRNDGLPGRTLMYIDNVEIEYCAGAPIPTYTPSLTPSATGTLPPPATLTSTPVVPATLTATATTATPVTTVAPTAIATAGPILPTADPSCSNILADPGFEGWSGWHFGEDPIPPIYVSEPRLAGSRAVQLGNPPTQATNVVTFSSVRQLVTIPYSAASAELRWWKLLRTDQGGGPGPLSDRQDLILLSPALQPIEILRRELSNAGIWQEDVVDISAYRGQTVYVYFNAFNDGNSARTWMYLDNVQLNVCGGSAVYGGDRSAAVATPVAIPLTPLATYTEAPIPTPSPFPTAVVLPSVPATFPPVATATATVRQAPAISPAVATSAATSTVPLAIEPLVTSNINPMPTAIPNLLVDTATPPVAVNQPTTAVAPPLVTAAPSLGVVVTPTVQVARPLWMDRVGPISVLLGILVLIGFIVWAILRTFRSGHAP
ncbi:MAG: hypothetical protein R2932_27185 [Caldilineaceae bacterium]